VARRARRAFVREFLLAPDHIVLILGSVIADAESIARLCQLKLTCRAWRTGASCVLADRMWRASFALSGSAIVAHVTLCADALRAASEAAPQQREGLTKWWYDTRDRLLSDMQAYTLDEDVQLASLPLLLLMVPACGPVAILTATVRATRALRTFPHSTQVHLRALAVLCRVARVRRDSFKLLQDCLPLLVHAIERFAPCPAAVNTVVALVDRTHHRASLARGEVVRAGVHCVLARLLREHRADVEFQLAGMQCLARLALLHSCGLLALGAAGIAFDGLRLHAGDARVQRAGVALLSSIEQSCAPAHARDRADYFDEHAGAQLLLSAGLAPGAVVQGGFEIGFEILRLLLKVAGRTPQGLARMLPLGLAPLVLRVMQASPANQSLQTECCQALESIASNPQLRRALGLARVQQDVCAAMQRFPQRCELQTSACNVLANTCFPRGAREQALAPPDAVALVVRALYQAMQPPSKSWQARALLAGIGALAAFMRSRRNIGTVSDAGGVGVLLQALFSTAQRIEVAGAAALALSLLAPHAENRACIQDACGVQQALRILRQHRGMPRVQTSALGLLASLVLGHARAHASLRLSGGASVLREALHPSRSGWDGHLDAQDRALARRILEECLA